MRNLTKSLFVLALLVAACGGAPQVVKAPTAAPQLAIQNGDQSVYGTSFGTGGFWLVKYTSGNYNTTIAVNPDTDRPLTFGCDAGSWASFMSKLETPGVQSALDPNWDLKAIRLEDGSVRLWHEFRGTLYETQGTAAEWDALLAHLDANPVPY